MLLQAINRRHSQRGQALVEYAVIAVAVILAFSAAAVVTQQLLSANVSSTMEGLSSPAVSP